MSQKTLQARSSSRSEADQDSESSRHFGLRKDRPPHRRSEATKSRGDEVKVSRQALLELSRMVKEARERILLTLTESRSTSDHEVGED